MIEPKTKLIKQKNIIISLHFYVCKGKYISRGDKTEKVL